MSFLTNVEVYQGPTQEIFKQLKPICIPLLSQSLLTPSSIPSVLTHLSAVLEILNTVQAPRQTLTPGLIQYIFFPLSSLLRRNSSSAVPDLIMEKILAIIEALLESWWWDCELGIWDQLVILCSTILGAGEDGKGKIKARDDETKEAAARCLLALLRDYSDTSDVVDKPEAHTRFSTLTSNAKLSIVGPTLTCLLSSSLSQHSPLQLLSLQLTTVLLASYFSRSQIPLVLPGVVSTLCKVAVGRNGRAHPRGELVNVALRVFQEAVISAIGDDICETEGITTSESLEDLARHSSSYSIPPNPAHTGETARSPAWLRATASQLHMSLNSIVPTLLSHPSPSALRGLVELSFKLLSATQSTLPQSQSLLLTALLSLSVHDLPGVSQPARDSLVHLLQPTSKTSSQLIRVIFGITRDNLAALPRLLPFQSDGKVCHLARLITAACLLAPSPLQPGSRLVRKGVGSLLGPSGGIEKWGWSLLNALELTIPTISLSSSYTQILDSDSNGSQAFPNLSMRYIASEETQSALTKMFHSLGGSAGEEALFAVEWFVNISHRGDGPREVTAIWCAAHVLEGIRDLSSTGKLSNRLEKAARWIAKTISENWDQDPLRDQEREADAAEDNAHTLVEHRKGVTPLRTLLDLQGGERIPSPSPEMQQAVYQILSLQLLSVTASILATKFTPLLLHTFYPVLHGLVSQTPALSSTALVALQRISYTTGYASASNLLLSNFDYALSSITRHLTRRHLSMQAAKALVMLVRIVGKDVVDRAADVVEACFDRLDDFHGYGVVVEGLIEVLCEVVRVVREDAVTLDKNEGLLGTQFTEDKMHSFEDWFRHRNSLPREVAENPDPAPGRGDKEGNTESPSEGDGSDQNRLTPTQQLTQQIVSHSLYFLTHGSPLIRSLILGLLSSSVPTLSSTESALLHTLHKAWPFILNRLADPEPFVVLKATKLIETLVFNLGDFMSRKVWEDVWPLFRKMFAKLETDGHHGALVHRRSSLPRPESVYTTAHQIYLSILRTMTAAASYTDLKDAVVWEVVLTFRRFLDATTQEDLRIQAITLYCTFGRKNPDAIWLVLCSTMDDLPHEQEGSFPGFLRQQGWDIGAAVAMVLEQLT